MTDINWTLIQELAVKPHKHLNIVPGADYRIVIDGQVGEDCNGTNEVMQEARTIQHLCDLAGVPEGEGYDAHIDARVYVLLTETLRLRERLDRIAGWHSGQTGPCGMVWDFCNECGVKWPCDTQRLAAGIYEDDEAEVPDAPA